MRRFHQTTIVIALSLSLLSALLVTDPPSAEARVSDLPPMSGAATFDLTATGVALAAAGTDCVPDPTATSVVPRGDHCLLGATVRARGKKPKPHCVLGPRIPHKAYARAECGQVGDGVEFIAHARGIQWLNQQLGGPSASGVSDRIQWEVRNTAGLADIVIHEDLNVQSVAIYEFKYENNMASKERVQSQLGGYKEAIGNSMQVAETGTLLNGYTDEFSVIVGRCQDRPDRQIERFFCG